MLKIVLVLLLVALASFYRQCRPTLPWAVLLFIASVFFSRAHWDFLGLTVRCEQITGLFLAACLVLDLQHKRMPFRLRWPAVVLLSLFPLMLLASLWASPDPLQSLRKSMVYFPYFLAVLALAHYLAPADKFGEAWRAFYVFGAAAIVISVVGFYSLFLGIHFSMARFEYGSLWLRGTMFIPNIMGSTAVIVFLMALARLTRTGSGEKSRRNADLAVLAFSLAAVLMSYTRAAWIGLAGGMAIVFFLRRSALSWKSARVILLVAALSGGFVFFTTGYGKWIPIGRTGSSGLDELGEAGWRPVTDGERYQRIEYMRKFGELGKPDSLDEWRFRVAMTAWSDWRRSPVIGRGTDSLLLEGREVLPPEFAAVNIPVSLLAILHDWGVLGLLAYCAVLLAAIGRLRRVLRSPGGDRAKELAAGLLAVLLISTYMFQITNPMPLSIFWCLMAFYAASISPDTWKGLAMARQETGVPA